MKSANTLRRTDTNELHENETNTNKFTTKRIVMCVAVGVEREKECESVRQFWPQISYLNLYSEFPFFLMLPEF